MVSSICGFSHPGPSGRKSSRTKQAIDLEGSASHHRIDPLDSTTSSYIHMYRGKANKHGSTGNMEYSYLCLPLIKIKELTDALRNSDAHFERITAYFVPCTEYYSVHRIALKHQAAYLKLLSGVKSNDPDFHLALPCLNRQRK
jgi:hypothetical protein